ncbi:hypothetical protein EZV62_005375 [Acer yangbiense]|uniref:Cellulose synthase n=1 Tax=Acer yangbiense TaxID=1000413 RepID=A0A5C7IMK7_9ROSI|nr:hypothetical protein EZV62_005375 [Acer yangbiense]
MKLDHLEDQKSKSLKHISGEVCRICSNNVGTDVNGELFVACQVCAFPVCRPCYEYERKDGNQSCLQCKTKYRRHKGSPPVHGEEVEDAYASDVAKSLNYASGNQVGKRKSKEHTQSWDISYDQGEEVASSKFDKVALNHIPSLTSGRSVSEDFSAASPERLYMASPESGIRMKANIRAVNPTKESGGLSGFGNIAWKERIQDWKMKPEKNVAPMSISHAPSEGRGGCDFDASTDVFIDDSLLNDEACQPLSRKVSIPSSKINPYRMVIVLRLIILSIFLHYRITNPVPNAYALWLISVICEVWFAVSWILDQFPKWLPVNRETYLDRLALRYDREGEPSQLAAVDIFVSTVDPLKEPPLVTANTVLSILAVDYPVDKVSCYVSDDGAAMLTFEALSETSEFARTWVPFYKVQPSFVKDRRAMKREYEEFKVRINGLVTKAQKVPDGGWVMQDGTPWPGNNIRDHPGMIQVFLGHSGGLDTEGNDLPRLVYVSREKRPGFQHHKKAGAMNALVRVSAVLTNGPFMLNLDCDHYINNSRALREAMCFLMDPNLGKLVCYVQFPQRFDGIDKNDRYANRNTVFFDINLRGLDGIQGPVYVGTGCVFNRIAIYGYEPPLKLKHKKPECLSTCFGRSRKKNTKSSRKESNKKNSNKHADPIVLVYNLEDIEGVEGAGFDDEKPLLMSQMTMEKRFGQLAVFVASTLMENGGVPLSATPESLLKEAIHVISVSYEDKTDWGTRVQEDRAMEFLQGLHDRFSAIRSQVLLMDPFPSVAKIYSLVRQEEKQQEIHALSNLIPEAAALNFQRTNFRHSQPHTNGKSGKDQVPNQFSNNVANQFSSSNPHGSTHRNGKPRPYCDHCKTVGHYKATCYKIHGYPPKNFHAHAVTAGPAPNSAAPLTFTMDQYSKLLSSVEILFSRHCPMWYGYGGRLKWLERFAYVNTTIYPITSIPLLAYCTLPAVCLLTGKFIIPQISNIASVWFISLFLSIFATGILEMRWSGVGIDEWWRNEQFWVIGGVLAHLFAVVQGLLKVLAGIDTNFTITSIR